MKSCVTGVPLENLRDEKRQRVKDPAEERGRRRRSPRARTGARGPSTLPMVLGGLVLYLME